GRQDLKDVQTKAPELPLTREQAQQLDDFIRRLDEISGSTERGLPKTIANYTEELDGKRTVLIGKPLAAIAGDLARLTAGWPRRVGKLLFDVTRAFKPPWLEGVEDLLAWIGSQLNWPVEWASGKDMPTKAELLAFLRQTVKEYQAVESLPHWPKLQGHLYVHPSPEGGDGTTLGALLDRFRPATEADRSLMLAAILTAFWGGRPGSRPVFLIESHD